MTVSEAMIRGCLCKKHFSESIAMTVSEAMIKDSCPSPKHFIILVNGNDSV